jgi:hypothetical protein
VDEQSLFDEMKYNGKINKGIVILKKLNQVHGVNEPVIVMVWAKE